MTTIGYGDVVANSYSKYNIPNPLPIYNFKFK